MTPEPDEMARLRAELEAVTAERDQVRRRVSHLENNLSLARYGRTLCQEAIDRVIDLVDGWEAEAGENSPAWKAYGPQKMSVPFVVQQVYGAFGQSRLPSARGRTWPYTTPSGHVYEEPTTYKELCARTFDNAQAYVEGWDLDECPPDPTWEMLGISHREVERLRQCLHRVNQAVDLMLEDADSTVQSFREVESGSAEGAGRLYDVSTHHWVDLLEMSAKRVRAMRTENETDTETP